MKSQPIKLSAAEIASALHNSPEAVVGRMTFEQRRSLLEDLVLGRAMLALDDGEALLDSLQVSPVELARACAKVEETRKRAVEQAAAYKQRQEIEERMREPEAALLTEVARQFGEGWQSMRPQPIEIDLSRDRVELFNAPLLQPFADALQEAMQGYADASRFGRVVPDSPECDELLKLVDNRHEKAVEAARRSA